MKLLVNVMLPAINKKFDMLLPDFLMIEEIISLLIEAAAESTDNEYVSTKEEILCYRDASLVMRMDKTLKDYGVGNGDTLVLI